MKTKKLVFSALLIALGIITGSGVYPINNFFDKFGI
jgi:hypothetical protein